MKKFISKILNKTKSNNKASDKPKQHRSVIVCPFCGSLNTVNKRNKPRRVIKKENIKHCSKIWETGLDSIEQKEI